MNVTLEQVRDIINGPDGNQHALIASLFEIQNTSCSYTASRKSYHVVALTDTDEPKPYLLLISPLEPDPNHPQPLPKLIPLPKLSSLLSTLLDKTAVPVPRPVAHNVSGDNGKWPFAWLLLRIPGSFPVPDDQPRSLASVRERLSPAQLARVELRLGTYLRELHGITNDWFGMDEPTLEPAMPSFTTMFAIAQSETGEGEGDGPDMTPYSWQDTFVLRLDELLERVCGDAEARKMARSGQMVDIDVNALRFALSRAIGSFLFDDVEMPRLVWVTGNEEDVTISLTSDRPNSDGGGTASGQEAEADIAYILPTFGHAIWGDPLMETWFLPPGPSTALKQGYFDSEDDTLIVFPRHKTKRIWYTVYLALMVLVEEISQGEEVKTTEASERAAVRWAKRVLPECGEMLKSAPCY